MRSFVCAVLLLAALPAAAEPVLLDRVVAVFSPSPDGRREVITLSDLEREVRLALVARAGPEAAEGSLTGELLAAALDWLLAELLALEEAEQLDIARVEAAEIHRELEALRERFPSEEAFQSFLERHEIGRGDLFRVVRRRVAVGRYLDSRIRLAGAVTEAEVRSAFEQRKDQLGGMVFEEARHLLRAQIEKERREDLVASLIETLRGRAGVRILHRFDGAIEGGTED